MAGKGRMRPTEAGMVKEMSLWLATAAPNVTVSVSVASFQLPPRNTAALVPVSSSNIATTACGASARKMEEQKQRKRGDR
eukprot:2904743-Rhodomonas_salina.4